ncbi:interleukin-6 receptor subunit beta isoform X5 [Ctenopharyngodon idella]|uniref:interleukin-6 receptor subunit beta isoform X1 n=1 Tax=Ctenopharyngodon idella TaxID=7959 RepID=UPI0022323139|nr:interleukin-6 receptor subunit beta isoform X1 [Ctenopharyngodon idella]XP_051764684.1 interleukin-6 receptor subunit beta isoform X1 [Ctenopharyngodon idella]XP_051764685.1 interleukin-6 receptor subunit beta isoform X3 [Ctenopharyngodon idella]XP_051764686.1 interleukin-6 receptor subunit beta isoform X4 [Ctenopharyngodon idella]XP_051764687.1 interleukin-6 receptor subunit beta isoform X5 [Ctenopharyngodon idella]
MDTLHHFFLLLMFMHYAVGSNSTCVKILPDSISKIPVEVGKNFTATCHLLEGSGYTSDDIEWLLKNISIAKQYYHKINETSVSVTVNVSSNMNGWLVCQASRKSLSFKKRCTYGILLDAGYPPLKPENLTCIAMQEGKDISSDLKCSWEFESRDPLLDTTYTLYATICLDNSKYYGICNQRLAKTCTVNLSTFPFAMDVKVWVEVKNLLGSVRSDELLCNDALNFVKPNPPLDVRVLSEVNFSTSLVVTWKHPTDIFKLSYVIRYCQVDSDVWTEVPESFTQARTESFRLQSLEPYTEYVVQMRCIREHRQSYWSDWSANATVRTAEAAPKSTPDLWRVIQPTSDNRKVTLVWKPPVKANGEIFKYHLRIIQDDRNNTTETDVIYQNYYSTMLPPGKVANIELTAVNSAGGSPKATLFIPRSHQELPGVRNVSWSVRDKELQVEWSGVSPSSVPLTEYLVEWVNVQQRDLKPHWQRVPHNVNTTTLTGFEKLERYNISVYPIYKHHVHGVLHIQAGSPVTRAAYIQQGSPLEGPIVTVDNKSKKNSVELTWEEIPLDSRCGFITKYTIFYMAGNTEHWQSVTVNADVRSHVLTELASETDYVVRIMASTVAGSKNGSDFHFKTMKYGDGEVEVIVVVVCLSFLFLTVFIIMFCLRKREVIKQLLWPQVPDPSDSSIAHWSPDFPVKANMPKEDVSVVEVDMFDGKSLCEEDKAVLPLKKDKYLSEEHSSGIGGSSCMSSPRHSVSDSDESDSGQTTASTVQYSSVVASGYKGQTPNHQPPVFARSESTQPLLDCEEHPDLLNESGGHSRNSYFRRGRELEPGVLTQECDELNGSSLTFCPVQEEEMSPVVEDPPASTVCYMPQQNGYRPQ